MYSWEIAELLKLKNYLLDVKDYFAICDNSPQIREVSDNPYDNKTTIRTDDRYEFKFKVKRKGLENREGDDC